MRIRALLIGAFVIVGAVSPGGVAHAADNGSWSVDCNAGEACFYRTACGSGTVLASPARDSNFTNDYFGTGTVLNNHATCGKNNFSTINIRLYTGASYGGDLSICFGPGNAVGGYNNAGGEPGLSSFKSC